MGKLIFNGIVNHDLHLVQGVVLTIVFSFVLVNIIVDVLYLVINQKFGVYNVSSGLAERLAQSGARFKALSMASKVALIFIILIALIAILHLGSLLTIRANFAISTST